MTTTISNPLRDYYAREREALGTQDILRAELQALGVSRVQADYDGVGDSGQIEELSFRDESEPGRFIPVDAQIQQRVENLLYALLNLRHGGWEINDGSFGSFRWNVTDGTLTHEHNTRFTDYESSTHEGFEVESGDVP